MTDSHPPEFNDRKSISGGFPSETSSGKSGSGKTRWGTRREFSSNSASSSSFAAADRRPDAVAIGDGGGARKDGGFSWKGSGEVAMEGSNGREMKERGRIKESKNERERERERERAPAMAARKRVSSKPSPQTQISDEIPDVKTPAPSDPSSSAFSLAPPKLAVVLGFSAISLLPFFYLLFFHYRIDPYLKRSIAINAAMSLGGFVAAVRLIPVASTYVLRRNLFGYDINKKGTPQGAIKVPESLGIVVGIVYLVVAILFQYFNFTSDSNWLVEYNAALASICFMILLGFVDDVLDVPWRIKLVLPSFAALPLLMAYAGHTTIIIPKPIVPYVGFAVLDLGWIYKLYMGLLAVFCTNSINIHAGLNGLEVGQTIVIASAILIHNVMQIGASSDPEYQQAHAFSIYLVQPLLATSLALFSFNWYPSSVFVGDTYTYFAGMAMAVVGILGHYSETLLLFFLPQILNFLYSVPQLFKIIPCPRHRLPKFDPQTGLLTGTKDLTLVNGFLRWFGRCSEKSLCIRLLIFQALSCLACFGLRYILTGWYK